MADMHVRRRPSVLPLVIVLGFVVVVLLLWVAFADAAAAANEHADDARALRVVT